MNRTVAIIGGGHAGFQLSNSLRRDGYKGRIVIFEKQSSYPYQRPPLSKAFLLDRMKQESLLFRPSDFYSLNDIELLFNVVDAIDRQKKMVIYDGGKTLCYDELVLAVGASPNKLSSCNGSFSNVYSLAALQSAVQLKGALDAAKNIIIVGTGFIGLEFASVAKSLGKNVHVISPSNRVMRRSVSFPIADIIKAKHIKNGVNFHDSDSIMTCSTEGDNITSVTLSSGRRLSADIIVVGVGSSPNVQLAVSAGLPTADGIIVDDGMRTIDPSIYAIGDCARFPYAGKESIRLESVQNAVDQARYLSRRITLQHQSSYRSLPSFWSDQGKMKIQVVGIALSPLHQQELIIVGDDLESGYACFCFIEEKLTVVETINRPAVHMMAKMVLSGERVPTRAELSGIGFDLNCWKSTVIEKTKEAR